MEAFWSIDRKSTRLNSSHLVISYAVFCLKKKTKNNSPYYACHLSGESPSMRSEAVCDCLPHVPCPTAMRCAHLGALSLFFFFFFNDTATTEIYTLSLHDALPI